MKKFHRVSRYKKLGIRKELKRVLKLTLSEPDYEQKESKKYQTYRFYKILL